MNLIQRLAQIATELDSALPEEAASIDSALGTLADAIAAPEEQAVPEALSALAPLDTVSETPEAEMSSMETAMEPTMETPAMEAPAAEGEEGQPEFPAFIEENITSLVDGIVADMESRGMSLEEILSPEGQQQLMSEMQRLLLEAAATRGEVE